MRPSSGMRAGVGRARVELDVVLLGDALGAHQRRRVLVDRRVLGVELELELDQPAVLADLARRGRCLHARLADVGGAGERDRVGDVGLDRVAVLRAARACRRGRAGRSRAPIAKREEAAAGRSTFSERAAALICLRRPPGAQLGAAVWLGSSTWPPAELTPRTAWPRRITELSSSNLPSEFVLWKNFAERALARRDQRGDAVQPRRAPAAASANAGAQALRGRAQLPTSARSAGSGRRSAANDGSPVDAELAQPAQARRAARAATGCSASKAGSSSSAAARSVLEARLQLAHASAAARRCVCCTEASVGAELAERAGAAADELAQRRSRAAPAPRS